MGSFNLYFNQEGQNIPVTEAFPHQVLKGVGTLAEHWHGEKRSGDPSYVVCTCLVVLPSSSLELYYVLH